MANRDQAAVMSGRIVRLDTNTVKDAPTDGTTAAVGFAQLYPMFSSVRCRRTLVLNDLYVAPDHRQQGVAWALLDRARRVAALLGAVSLSLQTSPGNAQARRLYERFGFVPDDGFQTYLLPLS